MSKRLVQFIDFAILYRKDIICDFNIRLDCFGLKFHIESHLPEIKTLGELFGKKDLIDSRIVVYFADSRFCAPLNSRLVFVQFNLV